MKEYNKEFLVSTGAGTLCAVLLFLANGCGSVARSVVLHSPQAKRILGPDHFSRSVTNEARLEYIGEGENRITVLYVTGTPYEMGYEQGRLLSEQVHGTIRDVEAGAVKLLPKGIRESKWLTNSDKREIVNGILDRAWAKMAPYAPAEDLQELEGLADGSGIPLVVLHRMHAIPDLGETSCSALVARRTATRDGHVYQLRILDYGANFNLQRRPMITVYRPINGDNAFANIGWIGFIGVISGMNDQGVAVSEMGFGNPPGETLAGVPMPFLLKNVLRYANNADEGAAIIRAAKRTNSYVYFLGDRSEDAIGMITSAQQFTSYHVNERESLEVGNKLLPQYRDVVYGGHYEDKQAELVRQMRGTFDLSALQELARQIAMKSNLQTVIYDLTADRIWVANRKDNIRASDRPYVGFSLEKAFGKDPSLAATPGSDLPAK